MWNKTMASTQIWFPTPRLQNSCILRLNLTGLPLPRGKRTSIVSMRRWLVFMAPAVGTDISCTHWTDISCTHWLSHYLANTTAFYVYWGDNSAELSVSLGFGLKVKYGFGCMQQPVNSNQTAVLMIQCFNSGNPSSNYPPLKKCQKLIQQYHITCTLHCTSSLAVYLHRVTSCLFTQSEWHSQTPLTVKTIQLFIHARVGWIYIEHIEVHARVGWIIMGCKEVESKQVETSMAHSLWVMKTWCGWCHVVVKPLESRERKCKYASVTKSYWASYLSWTCK